MSYASRKEPEYMSLRMVVCPGCDLLYAPRVPAAEALAGAYAETGYDSGVEARLRGGQLRRGAATASRPSCPTGARARDRYRATARFSRTFGRLDSRRCWASSRRVRRRIRRSPMCVRLIRVESFDAERLPESKFALIIANQTLEHVENPYGLLEAARRLLRPGGALMAVSHNYRHPLMRLLGARSPIIDIGHLQVFSPRSLEFALKRARFGAGRDPAVRQPLPAALLGAAHADSAGDQEAAAWVAAPGSGRRADARARVGNMVAWARVVNTAIAMQSLPVARWRLSAGSQILVEKPQHRRIRMAPVVLADQAVLGTRVDHHLEGLLQVLKFAEELRAVEEQHVVVRHPMDHQQLSL